MVKTMDMDFVTPASERAMRYREYVEALEEERKKIQVFHRELPLALHLVSQTIESCRQQMAGDMLFTGGGGGVGRSECEDDQEEEEEGETSSEGPVLEEFIPLKPSSSSEQEADQDHLERKNRRGHHNGDDEQLPVEEQQQQQNKKKDKSEEKPDWLRSVHLWSQDSSDPQPPKDNDDDHVNDATLRPIVVEVKKASGAFRPFCKEKHSPPPPPPPAAEVAAVPPLRPAQSVSSTSGASNGGGGGGGEEKEDGQQQQLQLQAHRKSRRCWSPELHRRFVHALEQLGGSHVATPKQIRELMKVDGLTNDEVKSHLQKFRLHSRRPITTNQGVVGVPPTHQVVLVGGIWVPSPEYALAAAAAAAAAAAVQQPADQGMVSPPNGVYAPVASVPTTKHRHHHHHQMKQQPQQRSPTSPLHLEGRDSPDDDDHATNSDSPTNSSSSSHTITNSPPF